MRKKGQVGLLVLVAVGVLVSLVLSIAANSLGDLVLSRQEKESGETFHVAEQGVEEALNAIRQDAGLVEGGSYTGTVAGREGVSGSYEVKGFQGLNIYVPEGEVAEVDLSGFSGSQVEVYWVLKGKGDENVACQGEGSGQAPAALEIIKVKEGSNQVEREYYNAAGCDLSVSNKFSLGGAAGNEFLSKVTVGELAGVTKLRLRPIYNGATVGVEGPTLPSQVYLIQAVAEGGDARKEIEVKRTRDQAVSIFDFALFSGGTIVK